MKHVSEVRASRYLTGILTAVFLPVLLAASGCSGGNPQSGFSGSGGRASKGGPPGGFEKSTITVKTTAVQRISIQRQVDISGTLASLDQAKVSSEVAGVVQQVLIELGQEVSSGQVVVRLDPRELELSLQRAISQLRQTEAQLGIDGVKTKEPPPDEQISSIRMAIANRDDAQAQLRRAQRLRNQNLLPQADLDTAETRVKVTEANFQSALETLQSLKATLQERRHAVELAQKKLNDTNIRATVSGQISERFVQQGEYIRENTPVISIVKMNPLKIKTAIQERYAGLIHPDLTAEFQVESFPGKVFTGNTAFISPSIDQNTRTFPVEIMVDNSNRQLKPGFFAKGAILTRRDENVLAVPEDTISTLAGVSSVYVIEGNQARQQVVSLGVKKGDLVEILSGIKGDETLAASNLAMLATGVRVNVAPADNLNLPKGRPANTASDNPRSEGDRP